MAACVCVAPATFDIRRFVRDTTITTERDPESVLTRKKRFFFPHERLAANVRRGEQGGRWTFGTFLRKRNWTLFAKDSHARGNEEERGTRGGDRPKGEERSAGKKRTADPWVNVTTG